MQGGNAQPLRSLEDKATTALTANSFDHVEEPCLSRLDYLGFFGAITHRICNPVTGIIVLHPHLLSSHTDTAPTWVCFRHTVIVMNMSIHYDRPMQWSPPHHTLPRAFEPTHPLFQDCLVEKLQVRVTYLVDGKFPNTLRPYQTCGTLGGTSM